MKYFSNVDWRRVTTYAGLPVVGMLAAFTLLAFIGPINIGDAWPAWVQAVGSVAAILVAIGIAVHERQVAKAEAAHRSHLEMLSRHTRANSAMERFQKVIAEQLDFARTQQTGTVEAEFRPLPLPEEMKEVERDCYLMEDAGGDIRTVTNYFLDAQNLAKGQRIPMSNVGLFIEHLEQAEAMSASALKKIRAPLWRR